MSASDSNGSDETAHPIGGLCAAQFFNLASGCANERRRAGVRGADLVDAAIARAGRDDPAYLSVCR
jgi:hypothetical protein